MCYCRDWCEITSVIYYICLWHVLAKCQQCSQCFARCRYKDRSSPWKALQSNLMRLLAVHAVKHKNAEEELKQPILQTVMLHSHMFSHWSQWGLHVSASETHASVEGVAGSGQRRQMQVDRRNKVLLSPSLSWRRNKEKSVLEKVKRNLFLLWRLVFEVICTPCSLSFRTSLVWAEKMCCHFL